MTTLPPEPPQPPPYGYAVPQSHGGAIAALVLGIFSLTSCCFPLGIAALILGRKAEREIAASNGAYSGEGMARAGWITGLIGTILSLFLVILYIGIFAIAFMAEDQSW